MDLVKTQNNNEQLQLFNKLLLDARSSFIDAEFKISNIFDAPHKNEVVRLNKKSQAYVEANGWMSRSSALERLEQWKNVAFNQYLDPTIRNQNNQKIVLSLFDLSGTWSQPWVDAGYQVFRFDIQADPYFGDINNFSVEFFNELFACFDGLDVHAILAACPCTDFAVSGARHFTAKDADGRTLSSIELVYQTLRTIEFFKPNIWAIENPVGRIASLTGLSPWRLSFDPFHFGDTYTKKTLLWGRFNADLPIAPVEPVEGSKMHRLYGGNSIATKNARSVTPEGFAYSFFTANNAHSNSLMTICNKYDRLDPELLSRCLNSGLSDYDISNLIDDDYYDCDDYSAHQTLESAVESMGVAV